MPVKETGIFGSGREGPTAENDELLVVEVDGYRETLESGMTTKLDGPAGRTGVAECSSTLGRALRSVFGRNSERPADAVVVFYPAYRCAVAAKRGQGDVVLFSE